MGGGKYRKILFQLLLTFCCNKLVRLSAPLTSIQTALKIMTINFTFFRSLSSVIMLSILGVVMLSVLGVVMLTVWRRACHRSTFAFKPNILGKFRKLCVG